MTFKTHSSAIYLPRLFNGTNLPLPRQSVENITFLSNNSLDLEIGSGQGLFAINYCKNNPTRHLVALEHTKSRFQKLKNRADKHNLKNLMPIHANAISWVYHFVGSKTLSNVFIWYPNPYPKRKHDNQRWHNMPFMGYLQSRLKEHGKLHLATNIASYAEQAEHRMVEDWGFILVAKQTLNLGVTDNVSPLSHFERKYLEAGDQCTRLTFGLPITD